MVMDLSGRQVLPARPFDQGFTAMDVSGLPNGVYIVRTLGASPMVARFVVAR